MATRSDKRPTRPARRGEALKKALRVLDRRVDDAVQEELAFPWPESGALHHYTDLDGFRGIVSSARIWAVWHRSARKDPREGRHADDLIEKVLAQVAAHSSFAGASVERARSMLRARSFTQTNAYLVGIACFTASRDSPQHWEHHGRAHEQVAISMELPLLKESLSVRGIGTSLVRVSYDEGIISGRLLRSATRVIDLASSLGATGMAASGISRLCEIVSVSFKPASLAWEDEDRLVVVTRRTPNDHWEPNPRPHVAVPLRNGAPLQIAEVLVHGPSPDARAEAAAEVRRILTANGYGAAAGAMPAITESSVRIRGEGAGEGD